MSELKRNSMSRTAVATAVLVICSGATVVSAARYLDCLSATPNTTTPASTPDDTKCNTGSVACGVTSGQCKAYTSTRCGANAHYKASNAFDPGTCVSNYPEFTECQQCKSPPSVAIVCADGPSYRNAGCTTRCTGVTAWRWVGGTDLCIHTNYP